MDAFMGWFFEFMTTILQSLWNGLTAMFRAIFQLFYFPVLFDQLQKYKNDFNVLGWILCILTVILAYGIWLAIIFLIVLAVRKYLRFRKTLVGNEDLLEEIADLHRDVIKLTAEKERILNMKLDPTGVTYEELRKMFEPEEGQEGLPVQAATGEVQEGEETALPVDSEGKRFFRLSAVDEKYLYYVAPEYDTTMSLKEICDDIRNFACSRAKLFYEIKTIRLMIAGLASTKLILLQGISGTGKTSLPYVMGKYFLNDATIASVQPSWRDRTDLPRSSMKPKFSAVFTKHRITTISTS